MSVIRQVILVGAAIGLVLSLLWSLLARLPGASRSRARKLLASAEWLDEKSQAGALVKLTGIVRARETGDRLIAPISTIRSVAFRIRAQPRRGGMNPRTKVVEKSEFIPFEIEDADGRVAIEPTAVHFDVSPLPNSKPDARGRATVLADLGHASANTAKSTIEETVLEIGVNVTVAGKLAIVDGAQRLVGDIACKHERRTIDLSNEP